MLKWACGAAKRSKEKRRSKELFACGAAKRSKEKRRSKEKCFDKVVIFFYLLVLLFSFDLLVAGRRPTIIKDYIFPPFPLFLL